ncbi:MAG: energy-coupling factor transporter ATPase, partial [Lachnospiraceae bacterium]|nr:energy-coupling factor transporter ATPase [Lachnospiraceae bacterium]
MPIFEVKNIYFRYDKYDKNETYTLKDVSFNVEKNDFIALIGKSGSGKSTLINHLNGLKKADKGDILYNGKSIYAEDFDLTGLRFKCGIVFQYPEYQLFSETVIEDVEFGALKKGLSKKEAYEKALEILKYLKIDNLKDEIPFNLSGGEKRKVAFAGVFAMEPDIFIFDEPDAGLDSVSKRHFYEMLKDLNENHDKTIICITHNLDDVIEYANKVIVLNDGKIERIGSPFSVLSDKELLKKCNLIAPYSIDIYRHLHEKGIEIDT